MTKKVTIHPFNIASLLYILIVLLFMIISLVFLVAGINNGFETRNVIGTIICMALSCFFAIHFGRYVFAQKIELYDDYFVITHIRQFKNSITASPFKLVPIESKKILYSDLKKYGFFLQKDLRKGGRDENNKKVLLFSAGKIPIPFVVPDDIEIIKNVMIYNLENGESISVDASVYGYRQIQDLFWYLQKMSGVKGKCSENPLKTLSQIPVVRISVAILLIIPGVALMFGLRYLDSLWNPAHPLIYESLNIRIYTLGSFFAYVFSVGVVVAIRDKSPKGDRIKPLMIVLAVISTILTAFCFVVSVWFG